MTGSLTGFDDWLNRQLEECARAAGEDVYTYVARAVASRMVAEYGRVDGPGFVELMTHLAASGTFAVPTMPDVSATVSDPSRLRALYATGLLDSPPEEAFDRITRAAAAALHAPYSVVSLIDADRQFLKSTAGMDATSPEERQTTLERSMCQYAVAKGTPLLIEDARVDPIYKNHPAVVDGSVVAYLGIPLIDGEKNAIGTLCVFDDVPRLWTTGHVQILSDFASLAAERAFGRGANSAR